MSKQRYIQDSFWTDPYIETLKIEEKLLFLYYLTNPLCNIAGIYEIRDSRVFYETKIPKKNIEIIKNKFVRDKKILIFKDWILFINFAKNQSPNPNVLIGMQRILDGLPSEVKALKGFESLSHFTLLNLTLLNLTLIPAKAGAKMNYKETEVNYNTNEVVKQPFKENKNKEAIRLAQLFDKMASEYSKRPILTPKSYFVVINAINKHNLKPKGVEKLFNDWFNNEKIKMEDRVKLSFALSASNINAFKVLN